MVEYNYGIYAVLWWGGGDGILVIGCRLEHVSPALSLSLLLSLCLTLYE